MIDFIYYAIPWTLGAIAVLCFWASAFFYGRASAFAEIGSRRLVLVACLAIAGCPKDSYGGNGCNLFAHRQVYQHHAVVQQVVAPYAIYQAGADIQADALAEKVAAKVLKLVQAQTAQQQKAAPEPVTRPTSNAFAKCASCHTGANAAGGVVLDGVTKISCHAYARWGLMAAKGKDIPQQMRALMSSLSNEDKGQLNLELLDLVEQPKAEGDLE